MRNHWDEDLAILSAENVSFSVEAAGLGSRLAALFLDTALQLIVGLLAQWAATGFFSQVIAWNSLAPFSQSVLEGVAILGWFCLFFVYFFVFEWLWDGQTPGKRILGLRVTLSNGLPLSFWPALVRNLVRLVDFLPFYYGLGGLVAMSNGLSQRAGDFAAGTMVVREGRREKITKPLSMRDAIDRFLTAATNVSPTRAEIRDWDSEEFAELGEAGAAQVAKSVDAESLGLARRLGREDYELARDFLARSEKLPLDARRRLAHSLALRLAQKAGTGAPPNPEDFIREIATVLARVYGG